MRIVLVLTILVLLPFPLFGQELDCEVTINTQTLTSDAIDNLSDFQAQVKQYLNNTRWTKDDFGNDRIKCSFSIFFQGSPGEGRYAAQVFVGSQRKIWDLKRKRPLEKGSATLRVFDGNWEFSYTRGVPLTRNDYRFDPLTSLLDFYAYVILGFDYDSYESLSGTPPFQRALNIFNLSQSAGTPKGWESTGSGSYSRTRLIDELMNAKFKDFRGAMYTYHSEGLDYMTKDSSAALAKILAAVDMVGKVKEKINQPSVAIKTFFDSKYLELCELFINYPDESVYRKFGLIDPAHQKSYEEYRQKRQ